MLSWHEDAYTQGFSVKNKKVLHPLRFHLAGKQTAGDPFRLR